jgi:hypothetical protein
MLSYLSEPGIQKVVIGEIRFAEERFQWQITEDIIGLHESS